MENYNNFFIVDYPNMINPEKKISFKQQQLIDALIGINKKLTEKAWRIKL